ncbi:MAG: glycosyltransferase family 4 protein [Proteobacteria bacterium]|nr:glycosyltransferase family 4 protein [Pseudomonadota bacterium]
MNIAQMLRRVKRCRPSCAAARTEAIEKLCDTLIDPRHEVTLFAAADACTKARLVAVRDQPTRLNAAALKSDLAIHLPMLNNGKRRFSQFDINVRLSP